MQWLTPAEASAYLQVPVRTLLLWARKGAVQGHVLSGTRRRIWRFRIQDLDASLTVPAMLTCDPLTVLSERRTK